MFAILETGSKQYKVEEGDVLEVELLDKDKFSSEDTVNFDSVLLVKDNGHLHIGQPFVKDATIQAKVLEEFKSPKVIIFKKKAKKQYRRTRGHRQKLHLIQIEKIEIKTGKKVEEVSEKPEPAPKETKKTAPEPPPKETKKEKPAAKEEKVKTQTKTKKEKPEPKDKEEKQVKTEAQEKKQEKKQTKTPTSAAKEKAPDKEKEKE